MRYLTLTLAPSGVDYWFVRYDTNMVFIMSCVNCYIFYISSSSTTKLSTIKF